MCRYSHALLYTTLFFDSKYNNAEQYSAISTDESKIPATISNVSELLRRDADAARDAMRRHVDASKQRTLALYRMQKEGNEGLE